MDMFQTVDRADRVFDLSRDVRLDLRRARAGIHCQNRDIRNIHLRHLFQADLSPGVQAEQDKRDQQGRDGDGTPDGRVR